MIWVQILTLIFTSFKWITYFVSLTCSPFSLSGYRNRNSFSSLAPVPGWVLNTQQVFIQCYFFLLPSQLRHILLQTKMFSREQISGLSYYFMYFKEFSIYSSPSLSKVLLSAVSSYPQSQSEVLSGKIPEISNS